VPTLWLCVCGCCVIIWNDCDYFPSIFGSFDFVSPFLLLNSRLLFTL
jgi:hypothetical protein